MRLKDMTLLNYKPMFETDDLPAGLRLFQDSVARLMGDQSGRPWTPAVDIVEGENDLVMKADVPGIDLKDIDIRLENGTLTIKGERKFEKAENGRGYHRVERAYGSFARSFALPETVDTEKVTADYKEGVLTVTIPKKEVAKPRSVKIEVSK
jgi:HSP20 family protein